MARRPPGTSNAVPWRSRTVQVVLVSTLLAPLGVPLVSPALPVIRDALVLTDAEASLLVSTYFLTGIVLSPGIGLLADRLGRRRVLVPSLFVFSLAGSAIALGPAFSLVLALRVVQGTAAAGIFIVTVTLVGDTFEGVQRNAVLGANAAALSAGAAVYPLVGGALATVSWNAPFVAYLLGLPVALFAARALPEPAGERERRSRTYLSRVASALSLREVVVLYGSAFAVELLLFGAVITTLPFLLAGTYGLSPVLIGAVVTAAEVAATVAASQNGRLVGFFGDGGIIAAGFGCAAVGLGGAWLAPTPLLVAAAIVVVGGGWGLMLPSVDAGVSAVVSPQFRAGALSVRNSATFLGRAAGPVLFTAAAPAVGYRPLLLAAGVGAALYGALVVVSSS